MKIILAWYLVTTGGYNSNQVVYSPPLATLEDCQRLQKNLPGASNYNKCIQLRVVVTDSDKK